MSALTTSDINLIEELFNMDTGYVDGFSNRTFQRFVIETIGIDPYSSQGYENDESKANKLRKIISTEPDNKVGKLVIALLDIWEGKDSPEKENTPDVTHKRIEALRIKATNMQNLSTEVQLPTFPTNDDTWEILLEDISNALNRDEPELVLDRLHTYTVKYLRSICTQNGIQVADSSGNYYTLQSLAGMLKNCYKQSPYVTSEFSIEAIKCSISLFEKFNRIRNEHSFAHDNDILNKAEAYFVVRIMVDVLNFMSMVEAQRVMPSQRNSGNAISKV